MIKIVASKTELEIVYNLLLNYYIEKDDPLNCEPACRDVGSPSCKNCIKELLNTYQWIDSDYQGVYKDCEGKFHYREGKEVKWN